MSIEQYPAFIAASYAQIARADTVRDRVAARVHAFGVSLRFLAITLASQYLIDDRDELTYGPLNEVLVDRFPRGLPKDWQELLFQGLHAYEQERARLFMPELHDAYYAADGTRRQAFRDTIRRLTQITSEVVGDHPLDDETWSRLDRETRQRLDDVLATLAFLRDYRLRVVVSVDATHDDTYDVVTFAGTEAVAGRLTCTQRLETQRFYLVDGADRHLRFHPLLVAWQEGVTPRPEAIGLFDRYKNSSRALRYLHATTRDRGERSTFGALFEQIVFLTIENEKGDSAPTQTLEWWSFRTACAAITRDRLDESDPEREAALYQARPTAHDVLMRFLASDRRGLVVLGASGVGKSTWLRALHAGRGLDTATHESTAVLLLECGPLDATQPLADSLARALRDHGLATAGGDALWSSIDGMDRLETRRLVLGFDAINEHPEPTRLLALIQALVERPYPWLKVIVTCRPEAWRVIGRRIRLQPAVFYRDPTHADSGHGVPTYTLRGFTADELGDAYGAYQAAFTLATAYDDLSPELRRLFRDPLALRLVAETFRADAIPSRLAATTLVDRHLEGLVTSQRLDDGDLRFLQRQLLPLMVDDGRYANAITGAALDEADEALYNAVFDDQILSDQAPANRRFVRLLDSEILIAHGQGLRQEFAFKYERHYEYFMGERLAGDPGLADDPATFFAGLIAQTRATPFLWGAIRHALLRTVRPDPTVLEADRLACLTPLCDRSGRRMRQLVVDTLSQLADDHREVVVAFLDHLFPPPARGLTRWRPRDEPPTADARRDRGRVVAATAARLGLVGPLVRCALDDDESVQTAALRAIHRRWHDDPDAGFAILDRIARQAFRRVVPHVPAVRSLGGLSLLIFFDALDDEPTKHRLQGVWRRVLGDLLARPFAGRFLRSRLLTLAQRVLLRFMRHFPSGNAWNPHDLDAAFPMGTDDRRCFVRLLGYHDVVTDDQLAAFEADLETALDTRHLMVDRAVFLVLLIQTGARPATLLPIIKRLFARARAKPGSPYVDVLCFVLGMVMDRQERPDPDFFQFFQDAVEVYQTYYRDGRIDGLRRDLSLHDYLGGYILLQHQLSGAPVNDWLEARIEHALAENDLTFYQRLLQGELHFVAIESQQPRLALDVVSTFFDRASPALAELVRGFLSRLWLDAPDEVADFLERHDADDDFVTRVRNQLPEEKVFSVVGFKSIRFVCDHIFADDRLRHRLLDTFRRAADCQRAAQWITPAISTTINTVYGDDVLPIREPTPRSESIR